MAPWRNAAENWETAEQELSGPVIERWAKSIWEWFGFSEKKGWDWLEFIARISFPVIIAVGGWYLAGESSRQQHLINLASQRDLVVSEYINNLQQLVLEKNLNSESTDKPVSVVARSLTLTALTRLRVNDPRELSTHKSQILQFLNEAGLVDRATPNVDLFGGNFSGADLTGANLSKADLGGVNLKSAILYRADLSASNLAGVKFTEAWLMQSLLNNSMLMFADFSSAKLSEANLQGANLMFTKFENATLTMADLRSANLRGSNLKQADLSGTDFSEADLSHTSLNNAKLLVPVQGPGQLVANTGSVEPLTAA